MRFSTSPIVGLIAVQPDLVAGGGRLPVADDRTLDGLLASLARCASLESPCGPAANVLANRISRFAPDDLAPYHTIRADVGRLADELAEEYALASGR